MEEEKEIKIKFKIETPVTVGLISHKEYPLKVLENGVLKYEVMRRYNHFVYVCEQLQTEYPLTSIP